MNNKLRFFLSIIILVGTILLFNRYITSKENNSIAIENVNKKIFKNMLLDNIIEDFNKKFGPTKYDVSKFVNRELDSNIYFYSQIFGYTESYFIIQYNDFRVTQLVFNFSNVKKENLEDITEIISLLIQISDGDIEEVEAKTIIVNMFKEFEKNKDTVTLVYDNKLIYTLNIFNNNSIKFSVR
ncbi:hypothetical protein [Streptobacillus moniliformis]|uniref:hypothetical protein n=1 Tax=Streptobacillus moniliformis TaxID=34105 RepID=UPI0007E301AD|nr:hypothetical protein [Streptobacillus moniliformis]